MKVMIRLLKMINPLKYVMLLGIFLGTLGHLAAAFITILSNSCLSFRKFTSAVILSVEMVFLGKLNTSLKSCLLLKIHI